VGGGGKKKKELSTGASTKASLTLSLGNPRKGTSVNPPSPRTQEGGEERGRWKKKGKEEK